MRNLSLLCRRWKIPIILATVTYFVVQLSMIYNNLFTKHPACKSPHFSRWTRQVNFFEVISFVVVIASQTGRLAINNIPENELGSYTTTYFVSFFAGISSVIKLCTNWTGNCEDVFGVRFSEVLWAEWISCVPMLYYIVIATDTKLKLTPSDIIILILITMVFLLGMCLHFTTSYTLSVFLLLSTLCCYTIGSILFYFVTLNQREGISRSQRESAHTHLYAIRLKRIQAQLALCLLLTLPLYPFTYFLSFFRVINHDVTFTVFTILNVTVKLFFSSFTNSSHHNVATEIIRLRLEAESLALAVETAANEARRMFVRYIMHEVRVPLSSITMGIGYLEQCTDIDEEAKEALLMMDGATGFMKQTLNDVLNMQKIEEGKLELDFNPFSITKTILRVKASLQGVIKEKQIKFVIRIRPDVPDMVVGDGFRVEHVIVNLVSNALKFSKAQSEVVVDVTVTAIQITRHPSHNGNSNSNGNNDNLQMAPPPSSSKFKFPSNILQKVSDSSGIKTINIARRKTDVPTTTITFSITDSGPGISDSEIRVLFLPFSQIRPRELQAGGGSGVGLAICKQIVELHGGSIECTSAIGVGSTFAFSIPFEVAGAGAGAVAGAGAGAPLKGPDDIVARAVICCYRQDSLDAGEGDAEGEGERAEALLRPGTGVDETSSSSAVPVSPAAQHIASNGLIVNTRVRRNRVILANNISDRSFKSRQQRGMVEERRLVSETPSADRTDASNEVKADEDIELILGDGDGDTGREDLLPHPCRPSHCISTVASNLERQLQLRLLSPLHEDIIVVPTTTDEEKVTSAHAEINSLSQFPFAASSTTSVSVAAAVGAGAIVARRQRMRHVLIVDDVSSNRRILSMLLRQRSINSTMAENGLEGVNFVMDGRHSFDLIFMDNLMPVMNGIEATKRLRAFGYPNLIIGLTGNALEEDVSEFLEAGADSVILKPVTVFQINQIIEYTELRGMTHAPRNKILFSDDQSLVVDI